MTKTKGRSIFDGLCRCSLEWARGKVGRRGVQNWVEILGLEKEYWMGRGEIKVGYHRGTGKTPKRL